MALCKAEDHINDYKEIEVIALRIYLCWYRRQIQW